MKIFYIFPHHHRIEIRFVSFIIITIIIITLLLFTYCFYSMHYLFLFTLLPYFICYLLLPTFPTFKLSYTEVHIVEIRISLIFANLRDIRDIRYVCWIEYLARCVDNINPNINLESWNIYMIVWYDKLIFVDKENFFCKTPIIIAWMSHRKIYMIMEHGMEWKIFLVC